MSHTGYCYVFICSLEDMNALSLLSLSCLESSKSLTSPKWRVGTYRFNFEQNSFLLKIRLLLNKIRFLMV